nr:hypothetical protein ANI_1_586114 [Aspergillus niger CBS 513.88]|eukprot:XP_001396263.2 hypothetical protein ANI_1_586114 [Aspergillus niger CBS 513.88]
MSATSTAPAPAPVAVGASNPDSNTPRPRPPRRGRGRGGRGRQTVNQAQAQTQTETQTQTAPDAPPRTQPQPPTDTTPNGDAPRPPRGPRGGNKRGGRGAGASRRPRGGDQATLPAGRIFGGRLTRPEQEQDGQAIPGGDGVDEAGLRADAPVFVPGAAPAQQQQSGEEIPKGAASASGTGRGKGKSKPPPPPAKVTTKSTAPDIATRIHEDIAHNLYECPICTICPQGEMEPPQCFRICKAGLHCGRHACTERCCPGEQKAIERQAIRRKLKSHLRPSDEDFEAEHICTRERRCNAAKAVVSKGQLQQAQRGPAVTPLSCDDECARLERNRSLASALGVDINPTTTLSQSLTSTNLPYSAETLDIYIQLSSSYPLSTLQTIESTLHTLATTPTERSTRFQPAKSSLRAFTHSLAADWGFASESFDPEPHRHVFVLKSTLWTPPLFGTGNGTAIGIGGMSVGDCVKLRDRQRLKEQEAQRLAAAEAKAQREAARAHSNGSSEGGWAQVAASKRSNPALGAGRSSAPSPASTSGTVTPAAAAPWSSSTMYAALDRDVGDTALQQQQPKKEKLVLRSGVKGSRGQGSSVEREKEGSVGGDGDA